MLTNIIFWIILGGIAGWIASLLTDSDHQMGIVANIIVGIIGALVGGFIAEGLGGSKVTGFNLYSLIIAIMGSVIVLIVLRLVGAIRPVASHQ